MADNSPWWRSAVIYQVYPRSFADGNGDGIGDVAGIRSRLDHLAALGVDAIWFSPWYPSPMADAGYDVSDYRDIDPVFGTLAEVETLIAEAHALGIRSIVDVVPNHCSDAHQWFRAALAGGPGAPERDLFWFRPGRGPGGDLPPTDWTGEFGGPTWTRTTDPDGTPGDWYLHLFAPQQPDFNWDHPRVREEFEDILRFWFERGVDGIRIDSAGLLVKDGTLPEVHPDRPHPFRDQDGVHDVYRAWRRIADSYPGGRALVGEVWLPDRQRFANYLRPDELHTAFNFDFLGCAWDATALRESIDGTLAAHAPVGAPATWVLSNHDVTRHVTRYGRADTRFSFAAKREGIPTDLELGTRRARAAALLSLALPGAAYVYQGEELGLWEVEDIPYELRQDPMWERSGRVDPGRDGCRVPLPWQGDTPPFGFSPDGASAAPWLPQPADWKDRTVRAQTGDPHSMLELYRAALTLRRAEPALGDGTLAWLPAPEGVLAFAREPGFTCVVNLGDAAVPLPAHDELLLASGPLDDDRLPPDTAVWLRTRSA
ncbi:MULTISPECIES: glycoside hydrolase family 13 protein [unclassified Micromonospora]|uniref:glycoside hydrolase family 13 protein n=1 Tax=unclassified Micromonospora TaxID=2617518 RepID=UPI0003EEBF14|nr:MULTISPECIES: glycoside hydrolase family 13 protein [unclassified Micromonospora]EWM63855.1 alpha-amylase [Micromonospora sp. M42]MCK1809893.1 glycoside hydrolase family 13 protein [Micromonospora sp. R42106]MCK1835330.1 glycoside hydrolase family 13 protein [Micromonospora sp. R42003]MCK1847510.1 glycoside hydrolase family 13 protein [Micromonospora sp. R42004]MCM1015041.1 glycoside hydrolase family 13 protein [Micromonospora sp. XM-20-01]